VACNRIEVTYSACSEYLEYSEYLIANNKMVDDSSFTDQVDEPDTLAVNLNYCYQNLNEVLTLINCLAEENGYRLDTLWLTEEFIFFL
jgi:hypothetical protein